MSNHVSQKPGYRSLSKQGGADVFLFHGDCICKQGDKCAVRSEELAMQLVKQHFPDFPIPEIEYSSYNEKRGQIIMEFVPGTPLRRSWDSLDDLAKQRLCHETWAAVAELRQIPKPPELQHLFQCAADGSATHDVLIEDLDDPPVPLLDDDAVRARIYQRHHHFFGRKYTEELPSMLSRSNLSVFTHGDIAPQNITVDEFNRITGIVDWERAGWYPDYWEYANILKPRNETDWNNWMDRTAPQLGYLGDCCCKESPVLTSIRVLS